jgi:hypothetical protein
MLIVCGAVAHERDPDGKGQSQKKYGGYQPAVLIQNSFLIQQRAGEKKNKSE